MGKEEVGKEEVGKEEVETKKALGGYRWVNSEARRQLAVRATRVSNAASYSALVRPPAVFFCIRFKPVPTKKRPFSNKRPRK